MRRSVVRVGDFSDLMELEEVDVIGVHHAEAVLDVLEYGLLVARGALGGYDYLVAHVGERETDLLFAVTVSVCGVEIVYPAVIGCAEKLNGGLVIAALNGETAQAVFVTMSPVLPRRIFCMDVSSLI